MQTLKSLARQFSILNFCLLTSAGIVLCSLAWADQSPEPEQWLQRMVQANQELSYQGRFVYQQGDRLDAMEIARRWQGEELQERIASLNGPLREILRKQGQVLCLTPSDGSLMLESQLVHGLFPGFNSEQWGQARQHYELRLGQLERVAGHLSQILEVLPKREDRFAYRLWLERQTGLLLRAALIDEHGRGLNQMQFVEIDLEAPVGNAGLQPSAPTEQYFVLATTQQLAALKDSAQQGENTAASAADEVRIVLPPGFTLRSRQELVAPGGAAHRLQQRVYSDGLSQLSIYIEDLAEGDVRFPESSSSGAVNLRSRQQGQTLITAVGELPDETLNEIVHSIRLPEAKAVAGQAAAGQSGAAADEKN